MKKIFLTFTAFASIISYASGATINISTSTGGVLTGLQRNNGTQSNLIWGIVVDTGGNGFAGNSAALTYDAGFLYRPTATGGGYTGTVNTSGQVLNTKSAEGLVTTTDDVLFIATAGMLTAAFTNDGGGAAGTARPSSISAVTFNTTNNIAAGQAFAVIWFDVVNVASGVSATLNTASVAGTYYGLVTNSMATAPTGTDLALPSVTSGTTDANSSFVGAEPLRNASLQLGAIPEPSAALLGALGALGLLRRRRN